MQKEEEIPKVVRQGWEAEKLVNEATNEESDDIVRKMLRGDETKGNPDERDIAGTLDFEEVKNKNTRSDAK